MSIPAGWYDDGYGRQRWWDGQSWTEHVQDPTPGPQGSVPALPGSNLSALDPDPTPREPGLLSRIGSSLRRKADERIASREAAEREQAQRKEAAGPLVMKGNFDTSTIEIYEAGYVRVLGSAMGSLRTAPYEKLFSIIFSGPGGHSSHASDLDPSTDFALHAAKSILKSRRGLMKASIPGLAASGIGYVAKAATGKSTLTIATDLTTHILTNEDTSGFFPVVRREQEGTGRALEQAGQAVASAWLSHRGQEGTALTSGGPAPELPRRAVTESSSITEQLRDLAQLHNEGILSDSEFTVAKSRLLGNL